MIGVLEGFAIIGVIIGAGYLIGRSGFLGAAAQPVLARTAFFVAAPCLLFDVISKAAPETLLAPAVLLATVVALLAASLSVLIGRLLLRRGVGELAIGALAAGYVNSNNIGLPVAVYVLGSAGFVAPVILLQLVVFLPVALVVLERATLGDRASLGRTVAACARNPLLVASLLGLLLSLTGIRLPAPVTAPIELVGGAAIPLMLLGFGLSLPGRRIFEPGSGRRDVLVATLLKSIVMPAAAWVLGATVFGLDAQHLRAAVVIAALPTAQNVMNTAQRYGISVVVARDTVLITTVLAIPVLVIASLVLG